METDKKVYKMQAIRIGAFLGGPLAVAYLMASNFKVLGFSEMAGKVWRIGIAASVVLFGTLLLLPDEIVNKIPNVVIPLVTMAVAQVGLRKYQEEDLQQFLNGGGQSYSVWRAIGMAMLIALLTLVGVVLIAVVVDMMFWSDSNGVKNLYRHH